MADTAGQSRRAGRHHHLTQHPRSAIYLFVGSLVLLLTLGLIMVWSSSSIMSIKVSGDSWSLFVKQSMFAVLGVTGFVLISRMSLKRLKVLGAPLLLISLALLVLVLIPGVGVDVGGQRNWLSLGGPFRLQPSEFAKLAFILWGAVVLAERHRDLQRWRDLLRPILPVGVLIMILIVAEGDFGNAMIVGIIMAGMLFVAGAPLRLFAVLGAVAAAATVALVAAAPHRVGRLTAFLDPNADRLDELWQVTQGMYAFGSGGLFGLGLGASREKWGSLPEAHTDFIFPVLGEELGLVGTTTVLILFGVLVYSMARILSMSTDRFAQFAVAGVMVWVMIQVITNIGASLKLLPLTGVTLPFLSYGGSSMVSLLFGLGAVLACARAALPKPLPTSDAGSERSGSEVPA